MYCVCMCVCKLSSFSGLCICFVDLLVVLSYPDVGELAHIGLHGAYGLV